MKCKVCKEKCDGKLMIIDPYIDGKVVCCSICFQLWTNQRYDKLTKRIKK